MYLCDFKVDGVTYHSSEQYIQTEKAKLFGDDEMAARIYSSPNPFECKQLSHKIKNVAESTWHEKCEGVAMKGCLEKFRQNENCLKRLLESNQKQLGEGSADQIWGIGISINKSYSTSVDQWSGKNFMGDILERIRSELSHHHSN